MEMFFELDFFSVFAYFIGPAVGLIIVLLLDYWIGMKTKKSVLFPLISSGVILVGGIILTIIWAFTCRGESCLGLLIFPIQTLIFSVGSLIGQLLLVLLIKKLVYSKSRLIKAVAVIGGLGVLLSVVFLIFSPYDMTGDALGEKALYLNKPQLCEKAGGINRMKAAILERDRCYGTLARMSGNKQYCENLRGRYSYYNNGTRFDLAEACILDLQQAYGFIKEQCDKDVYDIGCLDSFCHNSRKWWPMYMCFSVLGYKEVKWCDRIKTLNLDNDKKTIADCKQNFSSH